jgi:hypothetical protein
VVLVDVVKEIAQTSTQVTLRRPDNAVHRISLHARECQDQSNAGIPAKMIIVDCGDAEIDQGAESVVVNVAVCTPLGCQVHRQYWVGTKLTCIVSVDVVTDTLHELKRSALPFGDALTRSLVDKVAECVQGYVEAIKVAAGGNTSGHDEQEGGGDWECFFCKIWKDIECLTLEERTVAWKTNSQILTNGQSI